MAPAAAVVVEAVSAAADSSALVVCVDVDRCEGRGPESLGVTPVMGRRIALAVLCQVFRIRSVGQKPIGDARPVYFSE